MRNNLYINWVERNNTGIRIIDEQHKGIVSLINSLHFSIVQEGCRDITLPIARSIEYYTDIHFHAEQLFLEKAGYPDIKNHLSLHNEFVRTARRNEREHEPSELLGILKDWWLHHINVEDKKYVPHVLRFFNL